MTTGATLLAFIAKARILFRIRRAVWRWRHRDLTAEAGNE
jgi:hypothetical protein